MRPRAITTTEILDALAAATQRAPNPDDAYTVPELCAATGWTPHMTRRYLAQLKDAGRLQVVMLARERLDGKPCTSPGYRIRPAA